MPSALSPSMTVLESSLRGIPPQWLGAKLTSSAWEWDFTVVTGRRGDWSSALGNVSFEGRALDGETPEVVSSSHSHWLAAIS